MKVEISQLKEVGGVLVAVFVGGWMAYLAVGGVARAQADAGVAKIETRVSVVEQKQEFLQVQTKAILENQLTQGLEIRELYRAMMSGARSERLERAPDVKVPGLDAGALTADGG